MFLCPRIAPRSPRQSTGPACWYVHPGASITTIGSLTACADLVFVKISRNLTPVQVGGARETRTSFHSCKKSLAGPRYRSRIKTVAFRIARCGGGPFVFSPERAFWPVQLQWSRSVPRFGAEQRPTHRTRAPAYCIFPLRMLMVGESVNGNGSEGQFCDRRGLNLPEPFPKCRCFSKGADFSKRTVSGRASWLGISNISSAAGGDVVGVASAAR